MYNVCVCVCVCEKPFLLDKGLRKNNNKKEDMEKLENIN